MSTIFQVEIDAPLLKNNTKLSLIIAQSPAPTMDEIAGRRTNAATRRFINKMFAGGVNSHIARMAQSQIVREVVIFPEFAIAKDYWHEMDDLVARFKGSLIVIAGIGFWNEDELVNWREGSPRREFGFKAQTGFGSPYRTFNCGCCWVRMEGRETRRIMFLKNYNEQRIESSLVPSLVNGNYILSLSFEDMHLYPLICADVTCYSEQRPLDVVLKHVAEKGEGKRQFIATAAHEKNPGHPLWQRGIARALQKRKGAGPVIMAIANAAASDESYRCSDEWRNMTGVYVGTDFLREQNAYPSICCLDSDRSIFGALVRTGEAAIFAGEVSWDFGSGGYRDLWRPRLRALADRSGLLRSPETGDQNRDELLHSLLSQRERLSTQTPVERNQRIAIEEVIDFIRASSTQLVGFMDRAMLYGPLKEKKAASADMQNVRNKRLQGAKVIGALKISAELEWLKDEKSIGQLKESNVNILVWASPVKGNPAIRRDIQKWLTDTSPHPPLLIFADGLGGTFDQGVVMAPVAGPVTPDRRTDISAPPVSRRIWNFTANKVVRVACLADLRLIENSYEEQEFTGSIKRLLDRQLTELRGCL